MLIVTPGTSSERAKRYFGESLKRDDYYIDGQEIAGNWFGKGAAMLNLSGQVDQQSYFALCDNMNPETGAQLTPRQKDNRRSMYDWTLSAPKAVSVLYEFSRDERILDAFRESVRETMVEVEGEMKTRVRKGGKDEDRVTGNLVGAEFIHFTARPVEGHNDPHLHAHCVVFNTTFDAQENRWKASQQGDLKRDADYWEAAFHTRFASRLNALGYATVKDGTSFTLEDLPRSITDKFSQRRNDIEAKAAAKGITDAKGKHTLGASIRERKQKDVGRDELRQEWDGRLTAEERAALRKAMDGGSGGGDAIATDEAIEYALEHSFEKASTVSEKRLKAEALRYGVGSVLPEDVAGISRYEGVIARDVKGQLMTTTKNTLRDEMSMLQFASDGHGKFAPFVAGAGAQPALSDLSAEQRNAALHVLGSRDRVVGVRGGAGTGKTHMLQTVNAVMASIENGSGRDYSKVFAFAPSATASRRELRKVGFKDADTLATLLTNENLQAKVKKQVLLIDEAGLVSTKDMRKLFSIAKEQECRVLLVGDYFQHSSVEAGDAFRLLESEAGVKLAQLTEIRRQKDPHYRKAVEDISAGTAAGAQKGFDALDRMGAVVESSGEERHSLLVADYLKAAEEGKSAIIIAPTHNEGDKLTGELRRALKQRGVLGDDREFTVRSSTGWTAAQKGDSRNYQPSMVVEFQQNVGSGFTKGDKAVVVHGGAQVLLQRQDGTQGILPAGRGEDIAVYTTRQAKIATGDRIRITKNGTAKAEGKKAGEKVNNGDIYAVEGFTHDGNIRLEGGRVLPKDYGHFTLGYVDTSYASQGKTTDKVFISVGNESLRAADRQQWYVSVSRGREAAKIYVAEKDEVRRAIARTGERMSAVELTGVKTQEPTRDTWRTRLASAIERNRVARFLKAQADSLADYWRSQRREKEGLSYGRG